MYYTLTYGKDHEKLEKNVNDLIEKGFEPIGGVSIEAFENKTTMGIQMKYNMYQALINKDLNSKGEKLNQ